MWNRHAGLQPHHRADGRLLTLLLLALLMLGCVAAQAETPSQGVCHPDYPAPLAPEHEPTGDEYFTDAVFVGDSMMEYVELLGEIPTAEYVWQIGMGPATVGIKQFRVRGETENFSALEMIARCEPRKIYIMLGANGLDWYPSDTVIADYEVMVDQLIALCPEAMIYVLSAPPGSTSMMDQLGIVPGRYADFATKLEALAARRDLYFLDLYSILVDEKGALPRVYDSGDGFHMTTAAYQLMIDMVRRHTVPYPNE